MNVPTPHGEVHVEPYDILNWYECPERNPDAGSRVVKLYSNPTLKKNVLVCDGYNGEYFVIYHNWEHSYTWDIADLQEYETLSGAISRARSVCHQNINPPFEFDPEPTYAVV